MIHLHSKGIGTRSGRWIDDLLYRMVFRDASVILLSPRLYADVQRYVPAHRVRYCPNGIPVTEAGLRTPRARVPEILFLSNMIEEKGVYVLLEACRMLKAEQIAFRCRFVGAWNDVSEADFDRRIRAYGLTDCVTHRGGAYGDEKEACFADADVFAFPSFYHNEALPLVVIAAMKHSLPVVSTIEGGIADLVEDGVSGLLCPQRDVPALAAALRALLLDESLRLRMGGAGRERFEREFTLERFEQRLTSILVELAGDAGAASLGRGDDR